MHKFNLIALSLLFILSVAAAAPLSPELAMVKRSSGSYNTPGDKRSGVGNSAPDHIGGIGAKDKRRSGPQHTNTRTPDDR
jgi:hypothetical protein